MKQQIIFIIIWAMIAYSACVFGSQNFKLQLVSSVKNIDEILVLDFKQQINKSEPSLYYAMFSYRTKPNKPITVQKLSDGSRVVTWVTGRVNIFWDELIMQHKFSKNEVDRIVKNYTELKKSKN